MLFTRNFIEPKFYIELIFMTEISDLIRYEILLF